MRHFRKNEAEIETTTNEVLFSRERKNPVIFILHSGQIDLTHNFEWEKKEYDISFFSFNKEQYFGYESFTPNIKNVKLVTKDKSTISVFPLNNFSEIIEYNTKLFPILIRDLFNKSKKYVTTLNQVINKTNQLNEFNGKMGSLLAKLSIEIPREATHLTPYVNNSQNVDLDNIKAFIHSNASRPKYREFNLKSGFILHEFFQPDVIQEFMKIITTRKKIGKILFEDQIDELAKFHFFFEKTLKDLIGEFKTFYLDENSFIKLLKKNENKIPAKYYDFFFNLTNFFRSMIFENDFFKKIVLDEQHHHFLDLNIEEETKPSTESAQQVKESDKKEDGQGPVMINLFHKSKNEQNTPREVIKKFNNYNRQYIEFTKKIYKEKMERPLTNEEEDFVHFGIYDDLLGDKQIKTTKKLINQELEAQQGIEKLNVVYFYQWIERIIKGTEVPSNNDLGMSYRKHLLYLERFTSRKRKQQTNELESKINFEIDNMFTSILNSFNRETLSIYPLNKISFPQKEPEKFVVTRKRIEEIINEIKSKDFTVFFRETLLKHEGKNHIIQLEVDPIFIILPVTSSRIAFWQELVENKKRSQARFFLPLYYTGADFKKNLLSAVASYRWEICRTVKGVNWLDPVDGGITGSMMDYLNFYKKNSSLSFEQKERISNLRRKFRNDNKRVFGNLYATWLEYECQGVLRLNDLEREIFCKHLPFKKNIRNKLIKLPLYEKYITRYNNISKKELDIITRRFKNHKKEDSDELLEEVKNFIAYYSS